MRKVRDQTEGELFLSPKFKADLGNLNSRGERLGSACARACMRACECACICAHACVHACARGKKCVLAVRFEVYSELRWLGYLVLR